MAVIEIEVDVFSIEDQIIEKLREVGEFGISKNDIFNAIGLSGPEGELALWRATMRLEREGIFFAPIPGFKEHLRRIEGKRVVKRMGNRRRAGKRKIDRALTALEILTSISEGADRELASRAFARAKLSSFRRVLPKP